jgi:hypothetical protein
MDSQPGRDGECINKEISRDMLRKEVAITFTNCPIRGLAFLDLLPSSALTVRVLRARVAYQGNDAIPQPISSDHVSDHCQWPRTTGRAG